MTSTPWVIQGEEKTKFDRIFVSLGPTDGKLSGEKVKPVLLNSKLPVELLGKVWELSDIDKDGMLDQDEFCVAMYIVYQALENHPVPQTLPSNLLPPSKRKSGFSLPGAVPVLPKLPTSPSTQLHKPNNKYTGELPGVDLSNLTLILPSHSASPPPVANLLQPTQVSTTTTSAATSSNANRIVIPEDEKTRFGAVFKQHAVDNYIAGPEARDVFMQSGQPNPVLAHVWNMCDDQKLGKLTQDQFTLAMHFIMLKVRGLDIPAQLTSDMMPFSSTDSGYGDNKDSGSFSDASSGVGDFSAVRELDALNREIDDLRKEKDTLTKEIREKEASVQQKNHEVQDLQDQVDRSSTSLAQLESDKVESHDRLDELEQQQLKLDGMLADIRRKVHEEQTIIAKLKEDIKETDMTVKKQQQEHVKLQNELQSFKQEEVQLQQRLQAGKLQMSSVGKQIEETKTEITMAQSQIESLKQQEKTVESNIEQYDKALTAITNESLETETAIKLNTLPEINSNTSFGDDIFSKSDPFKSDDPFKTTTGTEDPFADTGVFATLDKPVGFDSDPFGASTTGAAKDTPNDDFFKDDIYSFPIKSKNDDPFSSDNQDVFNDKTDMFSDTKDAFATANTDTDTVPSFDTGFLNDPFKDADPFPKSNKPSKSETPTFKTTFDDDSSDFFGLQKSSTVEPTPAKSSGDDPWGFTSTQPADSSNTKTDFFGGVSNMFGNDSFDFGGASNTTESKAIKYSSKGKPHGALSSEDAQIAWVAAQSKKEEEERKEKLRIQEQADLELAIALSKQES